MSSSSPSTVSLPQYGFGDIIEFSRLFKGNAFLFRVYTPKERSPFADATDPYFLAPKFNEAFSESPKNLSPVDVPWNKASPSYTDVIRHLDWTTRSASSFISTSFSFVWSVWEGLRRYHSGFKHDVHIAIIRAEDIAHHSFTAAEILASAKPTERHANHWKWHQYCQESQTTLVYGSIPPSAVFASIPLPSILEKLPSYFLRSEEVLANQSSAMTLLERYSWSASGRKPSFKHFCRDRSQRFLQLPFESRLRDTTAGSVRLAFAFLSPWIYETAPKDFALAVETLTQLSLVVSKWPGLWWSSEHYAEISQVIHAISLVLIEQIRDASKTGSHNQTHVSWTVDDVLDVGVTSRPLTRDTSITKAEKENVITFDLDGLGSPSTCEIMPPLTLVLDVPQTIPSSVLESKTPCPRDADEHELATPRVPSSERLESRSRTPTSLHDLLRVIDPAVDAHEDDDHQTAYDSDSTHADADAGSITETESVADSEDEPTLVHHSFEDSFLSDSETACDEDENLQTHVKKLSVDFHPASLASLALELIVEEEKMEAEKTTSSSSTTIPEVSKSESSDEVPHPASDLAAHAKEAQPTVELDANLPPAPSEPVPESPKHHTRNGPSALETASYALTCFLIGSFITLCILSPHRRTLATHLT